MRKLISIITLALVFSMLCVAPVFAATINVPADYTTIQGAVNAAEAGDTIIVAAGTYNESVVINKSLTLLGAQADVDPDGSTTRGDESIITGTVIIKADNVSVNGFKLTSSYMAAGYPSALNVNISYNIFEDVSATWGAIHLHGYNQCDGAYVSYNTISGAQGHGIWTVGNDDVIIEHNHVLGCSQHAIECLNHVGTGITIRNNVIADSGKKGINYWGEAGAVICENSISGSAWEAIFTDTGATIAGNEISNCMHGILLYPGANNCTISGNEISDSMYDGIAAWYTSGNLIEGNEVKNSGYAGIKLGVSNNNQVIGNEVTGSTYEGILLFYGSSNNLVEGNEVKDNDQGIVLKFDASNNDIVENEISDSVSFDLYWDSSGADNTWVDNEYETSNF